MINIAAALSKAEFCTHHLPHVLSWHITDFPQTEVSTLGTSFWWVYETICLNMHLNTVFSVWSFGTKSTQRLHPSASLLCCSLSLCGLECFVWTLHPAIMIIHSYPNHCLWSEDLYLQSHTEIPQLLGASWVYLPYWIRTPSGYCWIHVKQSPYSMAMVSNRWEIVQLA